MMIHISQSLPLLLCTVDLAAIAAMCVLLRASMKRTVYAYRNISLLGGILFLLVFLVATLRFYLTLPQGQAPDGSWVFRQIVAFPRRFSYYAVFAISLFCIALGISNVALIRREGFRVHNALALLVAALYLGGTAAAYGVADLLAPIGQGKGPMLTVTGTVIPLFLLLMLCYFECILAGSCLLGWIAVRHVPSYDKDFIVILGCSIDKRGGLLPLLKGRVNRAVRFAWEQEIATGKSLRYVPSGGQGKNEVMSEGSAMELYLITHGAEENEVFPEKQSRNTLENFRCSKKVMESIMPNPKVAFATTNYHILRSGILARKAGLEAEGIAGDTKWYFWPNGFIREFFGILALERKAHLAAGAAIGIFCLVIGCVQYAAFPL